MTKRKTERSKAVLPPKAYEPTDADKRLVKDQLDRRRRSRHVPKVKIDHRPPRPAKIEPDHPDAVVGTAALSAAFGTAEWSFATQQLQMLINATHGDRNAPINADTVNSALAAVSGIEPKDEIEAMLASQMVATNHAAMDLLRRYGQADYVHNAKTYGNLAVKFLRTFTAQVEALQRYRGKGQQKIVVERVNVSEGGQAIVGTVERGEQGGGSCEKTEEQSHAKQNGDAPKPPLRGED